MDELKFSTLDSIEEKSSNIDKYIKTSSSSLSWSFVENVGNSEIVDTKSENFSEESKISDTKSEENLSEEICEKDSVSEECLALTVRKEHRLLVAQTMFKKSIKVSIKSFLISLSLTFLNFFI